MSMFHHLNLFTSAVHFRSRLTQCISVRWKRKPKKPSWLGIAKTKLFKIPIKKELPEWEKTEMDRLSCIYDRQWNSLKTFMSHQTNLEDENNKANLNCISAKSQENSDLTKVLIQEWNDRSALLRKERLEKEKLEQEETALKVVIEETEKAKIIEANVDKIVSAEIVASRSFVTKENLDEVLDECLKNVTDHNFALDLNGNVYKGESTEPTHKLRPVNVEDMLKKFEKTIKFPAV